MKYRIEGYYRNPATESFYSESDLTPQDDRSQLELVGEVSKRKGIIAFFFRQPEVVLFFKDREARINEVTDDDKNWPDRVGKVKKKKK